MMDKLPSRRHEELLARIRKAQDDGLSLEAFSEEDRERLTVLYDRDLIEVSAYMEVPSDPNGLTRFAPGFPAAVRVSADGSDYLFELAQERKRRLLAFVREIVMLLLAALIGALVDRYFLRAPADEPENPVPVAVYRPASGTDLSDHDALIGE